MEGCYHGDGYRLLVGMDRDLDCYEALHLQDTISVNGAWLGEKVTAEYSKTFSEMRSLTGM